ncbi:hypothetical protein COE16_30290 [Bacillus cereus]|nr:hypothetical protein BTJ45_05544 [Bacillus mycoides]PEX96094.1 hypothetical protein CN465_10555 [Bacillus cereus]PFJ57386.1 hypothetical protein COI99_00020 [Bacillus cereus]PGY07190.1 hypothetical protein COE16_30290 [Bacillus cereus]
MTQKQLEEDYKKEIQFLKEKEENLLNKRNKINKNLNELREKTLFYLKDFAEDPQILQLSLQKIEHAQEEVKALYKKDKLQIEKDIQQYTNQFQKKKSLLTSQKK